MARPGRKSPTRCRDPYAPGPFGAVGPSQRRRIRSGLRAPRQIDVVPHGEALAYNLPGQPSPPRPLPDSPLLISHTMSLHLCYQDPVCLC